MKERLFSIFIIVLILLFVSAPITQAYDEYAAYLQNGAAGFKNITIDVKILLTETDADPDADIEIGLCIGRSNCHTSSVSSVIRSSTHLICELTVRFLTSSYK